MRLVSITTGGVVIMEDNGAAGDERLLVDGPEDDGARVERPR